MTYINHLATVLKLGVSALTYLRLWTKFGIKISLNKLKRTGLVGNLLTTLADFLKDRKQRAVLNGQLLFLIYINDVSENLVSNPKLFVDDTSLFSIIFDKDLSAKN